MPYLLHAKIFIQILKECDMETLFSTELSCCMYMVCDDIINSKKYVKFSYLGGMHFHCIQNYRKNRPQYYLESERDNFKHFS